MTAESRREIGLNIMIGAGAIGGAAVGSPLGTALGMMTAGAQAPWGRLLVISAIAAPIALTVWLIGRAIWAKAWRDIPRERAAAAQGAPPQPGTHSLRLPGWNRKDHG